MAGPTMPTGMLVPAPAPAGGPDAATPPGPPPVTDPAARLRLESTNPGGFVELAPAAADEDRARRRFERPMAGARFLSADAMALLHGAFATSMAGFDPFRPHLLDASALRSLERELDAFAARWLALPSAEAARLAFPASELLRGLRDDEAWRTARAALASTIASLRAWCAELAGEGRGLWVISA